MIKYLIPSFIVIFGFMTLREGGSVLFIDGIGRQEAGAFVPFVLWFNFLTGFALVTVGVALFRNSTWVLRVSVAVAALSFLVLAAFLIFVAFGGPYEVRTLIAMPLRTLIWVGIAYWSSRVRKMESNRTLELN